MPDKSNNPFYFWHELKRRKVIRVIPVYAAAAFVLLELVDIIAEPFGLPDWTLKFVVVLLSIGFIISIILSWIYDITPEGVQKTKPINTVSNEPNDIPAKMIGWKIATFISVVVIIGLLIFNITGNRKKSEVDKELEKSIAVLPFKNFSADTNQEYMCDGLTDEIINHLYKIESFEKVVSLNSVLTYKGTAKRIPEIANELDVNYILEGTYKKIGDQIRVTAQLIEPINDKHIWQNEYDQPFVEIINIQTDIALKIALELRTLLSPQEIEQIEKIPTENSQAFNLYLKGRYNWNLRTEEGLKKSMDYFMQAIEMDNNYALAYSGLADAFFISADWNYIRPDSALKKARLLAIQSLILDNNLAESYATLGQVAHYLEYDNDLAELYLKQSLLINPSYSTANHWYAFFLTSLGKFEEAFPYMARAIELDPNSVIINYASGLIYYLAQDYDNALIHLENANKVDPESLLIEYLGFKCYFQNGQYQKAISIFEKLIKDNSSFKDYKKSASIIFSKEGIEGWIEYVIDIDFKFDSSDVLGWLIPAFYLYIGETDEALDILELNVTNRTTDYMFLGVDPAFEDLHSEPRFISLLEMIGITP